jgi:hypothetical protein
MQLVRPPTYAPYQSHVCIDQNSLCAIPKKTPYALYQTLTKMVGLARLRLAVDLW